MPKFDFVYSLWFLPLGGIVAAVLAWFMYRKTESMLSRGLKSLLMGLRFTVWLGIFLLLLEPILTSLSTRESAPIITVVQDNSESLVIQKDSNFVRNEYPELLKSFLQDLEGDKASVQYFSFGSNLHADADPDSLSFSEVGTNLSGTLGELRDLYANSNLGAVVLASDGISNAGSNPLYELDGFGAPVYTVLLGDTALQKDIKIERVLHNEIAFLDNETPLRVKLASTGYPAKEVSVVLQHRGKTLDTRKVTLGGGKPFVEVPFMVRPEAIGRQRFDIHISELPDEISTRNNHSSVSINVLETKVKIALFGGFSHPDLGAIEQTLERDQRYELTQFVHKDASTFFVDPAGYSLTDFDLIIMHNFPLNDGDAKWVTAIKTEVEKRKVPTMTFYGLFTDQRTMTPFHENLAIAPTRLDQGTQEFEAAFRDNYRQHSTFTFNSTWLEMMSKGGPLYRRAGDWSAKSDAKLFATASIKKVVMGDNYPVFALRNHLGQKNMTFTAENIWRLRQHSYRESEDFSAFDDWFYNLIQWLMVKEDKRKFRVQPVKPVFSGSERILFKGNVYDDSYNPLSGVEIKVSIKDEEGKDMVVYMQEVENGQYSLELSNLATGNYTFIAEGTLDGRRVGDDRGGFEIGRSNIEHFQLQADRGVLEQISLRTGGKTVEARNIGDLTEEILNLETLKPVVDYKQSRKGFHDFWWILGILILLLGTEWVLRKLNSLL